MKIFILSFFILFFKVGTAQYMTKANEYVNIKALMFQHYDQLYSFNIDVYKKQHQIKVVYCVLDSVIAKNMFQIFLAYGDTADVPARFFLNIDSIATTKNLYKKDSIEFLSKNNSEYFTLIDSCFLRNAHQFDNKQSPDVVHTGGVFYRFTFEKNQKVTKVFGAVSPTEFDYPFLARLVKETIKLYKKNNNDFLNGTNTNGKYYR